ncbi:MAG: AMIN domain-containing protein, partial [Gammaproteobacteria bacterium]|nr:AMIN domain-containing protein [Gammaproteobacteria bacterium]
MKIARVLFLLFISLVAGPVLAKSAVVGDVRVWAAPDHTRIVFEISGPVQHKLFSLPEPNRIVIDLSGATLDKSFSGSEYSKGIIKRIRSAPRNQDDLRVVLDISKSVKAKSFVLKPSQNYSHRLVIDLYEKDNKKKVADRVVKKKSRKMFKSRELVIAIDAGHGGDDPGAIGYRGTREKDVVFAIAKKLEALVNKEAGMRPVMIRKGDYYVGLRN